MRKGRVFLIAITAIMIAVTAVFTLLVRVPIPATQGYFNFSDVAVYFAAFSFGPWIGLIAGGVGAALADVIGGWAQYAPLTFFAHGLQGLVAGFLGRGRGLTGLLVAWAVGTTVMVGVYFVGEFWVLGLGPEAWAEVPANLIQNVAGGLVGIPLYYAVRKAYPPIVQMGRPMEWREE